VALLPVTPNEALNLKSAGLRLAFTVTLDHNGSFETRTGSINLAVSPAATG
jgi:hypothetical protein